MKKTLTQMTIKVVKGFYEIQDELSTKFNGAEIQLTKVCPAEWGGDYAGYDLEFSVNGTYSKDYELWAVVNNSTGEVYLKPSRNSNEYMEWEKKVVVGD